MKKLVSAPEIELKVLGEILYDSKCLDEIFPLINVDIFSDLKHQIIFAAIEKIYNEGNTVDTVTIYNHLKSNSQIEDIGGVKYLGKLSANSSVNIIEHIKILTEKWMLRKIQKSIQEIEDRLNKQEDAFELLTIMTQRIYEIENQIDAFRPDKTLWTEFPRLMDLVEKKYRGEISPGLMCSSFPTLNNATGGIMHTDLVTIYGKDKSGKTSLTERLILDFAFQNIPVGVFPMEIDIDTYAYKAYSMEGNIEYLKLRNPRGQAFEVEEFRDFYRRAQKFEKTKIYVDDILFDFERMIAKAKLWKRKYKIGLYVFDYLGLIQSSSRFERRDLQLAYYTGRLKNLAKELNTPVIVVSQANEDKKTADSKGAMRDSDFAIYLCKPIEEGIKNITSTTKDGRRIEHQFNDGEFLATVERSRHGKNKQNFICGFVNNNFVEISIEPVMCGEVI